MRYLLHDVFNDSVQRIPNNIAVYMEGEETVTYEKLNNLANKFANFLKLEKNIVRERPFVGILSTVHINSIAAVLGTLKIGCAYVPLDEYSPPERLAKILENTNLDIIVMDPIFFNTYKDLLSVHSLQKIVFLDHSSISSEKIVNFQIILDTFTSEPPKLNQVSDDLAYILHSSGSTGIPKGVMLTHRNARTFVDWMEKEFTVVESDVIMSRAPFKFDLSIFDIFNTFKAGARLVCYDWNKKRAEENRHTDYVKLMEDQRATILYTTPSTFITLLNRGSLGEANLRLREIMYAGEPFPTSQLRKLHTALPGTKIANIYGPTETNIITRYWVNVIPEDDSPIPLGKEVDDTEIMIVSEDGKRICDPEEMGELWCRGGTVTLGYLGMPEKNAEHLVISPFHNYPAKFWRTGDFGYRDSQGILHYKGRKDHMVKVKGFRIELGEVESALAQNKNLDEFAVVSVPDEKYGNRLYCYYSVLKGKSLAPEELKAFLLTKIPEYMIPFKFIFKEIFPKTSSGKIDRVRLAEEALEIK